MGREIVRLESVEEAGKRSRMWLFEDFKRVLEEDKGSSKIETIYLTVPISDEKVKCNGEAFKKMDNPRTLVIDETCFSKGPEHLPNSLRVLRWKRYPSPLLPCNFHPKKLAILDLPFSCLTSLNFLEMQEKFVNLRCLFFDNSDIIKEIPDVSAAPNLEQLSFSCCNNLVEVHRSIGTLDKLRMLDAHNCPMLRSFPALMLPSLEYLDLSWCSSLESFPEILGKMENLTELDLCMTFMKELPFSIRLMGLQRLVWVGSGIVQLPSSLFVLPELEYLRIEHCNGLVLCMQHEDEELVSSTVFSNQPDFEFSNCNVSDEFLRLGFPLFANVNKLDLNSNPFTIIPACIKGCSFLKELILDYCQNLQEIRGIPPNIETFSARHCTSLKALDLTLLPACTKECCFLKELSLDGCKNLWEIRGIPPNIEVLQAPKCTSLTSTSRSMLQKQDLHQEDGDKEFLLPMPGTNIQEWFNHSCQGLSISFWFRNKFPTVSLCVVNEGKYTLFYPKLIINSHEVHQFSVFKLEKDHILILGQLINFKDEEVNGLLSENEWYHVEMSHPVLRSVAEANAKSNIQIGLHVFKQSSSMEDIRFTDPLLSKEEHRLVETEQSQTQFMQQQQQNLASLKPLVGQGKVPLSLSPTPALKDNVNWDLTALKQISSITSD